MNVQPSSYTLLQPGLQLLKQALHPTEQIELIKILSQQTFLSSGNNEDRKRLFDRLDRYPLLSNINKKLITLARRFDESFPEDPPTHFIALRYNSLSKTHCHIPWHVDNGNNDGQIDFPVTSISLGDSCDFLVCNEKPKSSKSHPPSFPLNLAHRIRLDSGNCLIFHGPSRMIWHSIYDIFPNEGYRFNITFRRTPHLLGKENEYSVIPSKLTKNNRFFSLTPDQGEQKKSLSFEEFKLSEVETFEKYCENSTVRCICEDDHERLVQAYENYCKIKYNQYQQCLEGYNPARMI